MGSMQCAPHLLVCMTAVHLLCNVDNELRLPGSPAQVDADRWQCKLHTSKAYPGSKTRVRLDVLLRPLLLTGKFDQGACI